jgi:flavin reductase (DIM6/NTAB) family NADH-FMN oxidoreductase RutF
MTSAQFKTLRPADLRHVERAKLLNGIVVPRPIAVVSSISPSGQTNVAPFSYFNVVGEEPIALSFSITAPKADGSEKDTLRNVRPVSDGGTGGFVVNAAASSYAEKIAACGASLPYGTSEFEHARLTPVPSKMVDAPRIGEAPSWFECRTVQIVEVGRSRLVIGEVLLIGIRADLIDERLRVDIDAMALVARLAGAGYCRIGKRFDL